MQGQADKNSFQKVHNRNEETLLSLPLYNAEDKLNEEDEDVF